MNKDSYIESEIREEEYFPQSISQQQSEIVPSGPSLDVIGSSDSNLCSSTTLSPSTRTPASLYAMTSDTSADFVTPVAPVSDSSLIKGSRQQLQLSSRKYLLH